MILEIAGGQVVDGVIDQNCLEGKKVSVALRMSRLNSLLGFNIDKDTAKDILERLQFTIKPEGETWKTF